MDMGSCFDARDDTVFMEIEKQLLLLISDEGEDEGEVLCAPSQTSVERDMYPKSTSQHAERGCQNYYPNQSTTLLSSMQSSTRQMKVIGTGVFIPHLPAAPPVKSGNSQKRSRRRKLATQELRWTQSKAPPNLRPVLLEE